MRDHGSRAALLIAALLLWTYTTSRITKIPLDLDTTLISDGNGTALDPGRCPVTTTSSTRTCRWYPSNRSASSHPPTPMWSRCKSAALCGAATNKRTRPAARDRGYRHP
ncbi:hypothetical protein I552_0349 [Mycobacterium xenopi 3993]|nr:hypothetical protein I552_0349 [Mycobacterium xenopi 3993]